ncbi:MAG: hypothetical protein ABIP55_02600, partial [Tepidisphaeraceae bacterium]
MMDPTFVHEGSAKSGKKRRMPFDFVGRAVKMFARVLLASPFGGKRLFRNEEGTKLSRFLRALTYRLAFVPIILVIFLTALVFAATHPGRSEQGADPSSFGVYYDPVNFLADDGAR